MLMFHRGLQFFKALLREGSHVNLIIAPCGEEGSLLLPNFLDQEPKMEPDEVVMLSGRLSGAHSLLTPARSRTVGLWGWNSSLEEMKSHAAWTGLVAYVGTSFPASDSVSAPLFCLKSMTPGGLRCYSCEEGTAAFWGSTRRLHVDWPWGDQCI